MIALLEAGTRRGRARALFGLFTSPGAYAQRDEMIALCRVVERHDAGYFTHLRDKSNKVLDALDEAIDIARPAACTSRSSTSNAPAWTTGGRPHGAREDRRGQGARTRVDCNSYPYAAGSNPLKNLMPQWVQAGGVDAMLARLAPEETRDRIRADIERDGLNNWGRIPSWDCVQVSISPICRSSRDAPSARSRKSAGKTRSTSSATT